MELAGIEPASENSSIMASPITVCVLTFPPAYAHRQAYAFSSFINLLTPQSLGVRGLRKVGARSSVCGRTGADSCFN